MAEITAFVETIKRAAREEREASKPVRVCFGKVVSKFPLKINVEQKMVLGESQLILTRNVTDFSIMIGIDWETEKEEGVAGEKAYEEHQHRIFGQKRLMIHNALSVGEEVVLIRQQEGQKFLVVDRIGGKA